MSLKSAVEMGASTIILTDYPKAKHIEAHYRGISTERLLEILEGNFSMMMDYTNEEQGGYYIEYRNEGIEAELKFRKVAGK
jgi:hypothetical protein